MLRFADRTALSDYLMGKYDTSWGQDTASPFIMENDKLMDGWRPNTDGGHTPTLHETAALRNTARASVNTNLKAEGLLCDHGSVC